MSKPLDKPLPPSGDSSLAAAFEGRMRIDCLTRYTCPLCGNIETVDRGLMETGAQVRQCGACGGESGRTWGGPPDELEGE